MARSRFVIRPTAKFTIVDLVERCREHARSDDETCSHPGAKVLVTQGEDAFVEMPDGARAWVRTSSLRPGRENAADWRAALREYLRAMPLHDGDDDATAPDTAAVVDRALAVWRAGHAVVLRGLLAPAARASVHAAARDCVERGWGTVRRRSVGLPDDGRADEFPQQTHARLSRRFRDACPAAWSAIARAVAAVDRATFRRFEGGEPTVAAAFKQADYLVYQGRRARGDFVGWHDHYGESLLFCVALLGDGPFEGGEFGYRPLGGGDDAVEVALAPGDVVVCPSEMEHRVGPVLAGVRVSMNIDFWDVEEGNDRRSEFDRF